MMRMDFVVRIGFLGVQNLFFWSLYTAMAVPGGEGDARTAHTEPPGLSVAGRSADSH